MKGQKGLQQEVNDARLFSFFDTHGIIENTTPPSPISRNASPDAETTTQQAGRLFSNFSSFLTRKSKEFSLAMEVTFFGRKGTQI